MSNIDVSLVSTVFNEAKRLEQTICDLEAQTYKPREIIIVDAGSTDGTLEMLHNWKKTSEVNIVILQKLKCNVAEGRNLAIRTAKSNIIVSTDFGCRFKPNWIESLVKPFENNDIDVVGGSYSVDKDLQITLAAKTAYFLANGYTPDVSSKEFIPSSRSIAYKKEVFDEIGGYQEWLTLAGDDTVFGLQIKANKFKMITVSEPNVLWGRHEKAKGFIKEFFRYGLGDGEAHVNKKNIKFTLILLLILSFLPFSTLLLILALGISDNAMLITLFGFTWMISLFLVYKIYIKKWIAIGANRELRMLFYGYWLFSMQLYNYAKGYMKGYFFASPLQKAKAVELSTKL